MIYTGFRPSPHTKRQTNKLVLAKSPRLLAQLSEVLVCYAEGSRIEPTAGRTLHYGGSSSCPCGALTVGYVIQLVG